MKQRPFGNTQVSEVGLGTWQLGADWGEVDDAMAHAILEAALEQGITFFDTADVYGLGLSEKRIAKFLKTSGANVTLATKLGRFPAPGWPQNFDAEIIEQHTDASLLRLGVEVLDLTQLHCIPKQVLQRGDVFNALRSLQTKGKIRHFGASVESIEEARLCLQQDGLASLQIIFNLFRQDAADALLAEAEQKGVAIIVRLPLASGLLSGKFDALTEFEETDHRNYNRNGEAFNVGETFSGLPFDKGVELVSGLTGMLPSEVPMARAAIRWCLDHEQVTVVIPGATKIEQVISNAQASRDPALGASRMLALREFYQTQVRPHVRGEI